MLDFLVSPAYAQAAPQASNALMQFAPLIFLIFWIGVYPKPLLSYIEPQTNVVVAQVEPDYFKSTAPQVAEQPPGSHSGESEPTR